MSVSESRMVRVRVGDYIVSWDPEGTCCGVNCDCCGYGDGTTPADHARDCQIRETEGDCSCGASC